MAITLLPTTLTIALAIFLLINFQCHVADDHQPRQVYIVFVDPSVKFSEAVSLEFLGKVLDQGSYRNFNAFSASLTEKEAKELAKLKGILQVQPSKLVCIDKISPGAPVESNTTDRRVFC